MRCGYVLALVWAIARAWGHAGSYRLCLRPIKHSLDATCLCANVCYSIFAQLVVLFLRFELRLHESSTLCAVCCNRTVIAQASRRLVRDSRLGDCLKLLDEMQLLAPDVQFSKFAGTIPTWLDPCMVLSPRWVPKCVQQPRLTPTRRDGLDDACVWSRRPVSHAKCLMDIRYALYP